MCKSTFVETIKTKSGCFDVYKNSMGYLMYCYESGGVEGLVLDTTLCTDEDLEIMLTHYRTKGRVNNASKI